MSKNGILETFSRNLESRSERPPMADACLRLEERSPYEVMRSLGAILAPDLPLKSRYGKIFAALSKRLPPGFRLTERQVRAIHNNETDSCDWKLMKALLEVEALEEARRARRQLAATTTRLAALLEEERAALSCEEHRAVRRLVGAAHRAGIEGGDAR